MLPSTGADAVGPGFSVDVLLNAGWFVDWKLAMFPNAKAGFSEDVLPKENVPPEGTPNADGVEVAEPNIDCPLPKGEVVDVAALGALPTASDADGAEEAFVEPSADCPLPVAPDVDPNNDRPLPAGAKGEGADVELGKPNAPLPPPPKLDGVELIPKVGAAAKVLPVLFSELLPPTSKGNFEEAGAAA